MKSSTQFLSFACAILAGGILSASCQKETPEDQTQTVPFKSISLTCDGETAQGVLIDEQNIRFTFKEAEDFTSATISIELNEGFRMTYPTSLTDVDLASTPVFNFADSRNKISKYYIKFSSNAFPIVDESKIQIEGLQAGECISLDNTNKTLTIKYDQEKIVYERVKLNFLEGSLQEGVELPEDLEYDFTEGLEQELILNFEGERKYIIRLDVSAYQKKQLSDFAFTEETFKYNLPEDSPVHVYSVTGLVGMPVSLTTETQYAPNWDGNNLASYLYGSGNPRDWEGWITPPDMDKDRAELGYPDWSFDEMYRFPGDWKDDRITCNLYGRFVIVYIDREKVNVDMDGATSGVRLGNYSNLVVASGLNHTSNTFKKYLVNIDGQQISPEIIDIPYRASIGTENGKLKFDVIAYKDNGFYRIPYQNDYAVDRMSVASAADEKWEADNAAWAIAYGVRDGRALKINEMVANDGTDYISDDGLLGMGWATNFYNAHMIVGTTYDNKIALMLNCPGTCNWDGIDGYVPVDNACNMYTDNGFNFYGYSLKQMFWIASQLGWKDAVCIGHNEDNCNYNPNIVINGIGVMTASDHVAYANTSDLTAGYVLTIDSK